MSLQLPDPIATFFRASNDGDASLLEPCFTDEAVVRDEGNTYRGLAEITNWLREAKRKSTFSSEPLDIVRREREINVRARVSGSFPGSPIELNHLFRLTGGKVEELEIGQ